MAVWAIDGVNTPASVARVVADAALKGGEGVIRPTHHQITETNPPGKFLTVLPGATSIKNTYAGVDSIQRYVTEDTEAVDVPVPETGSSPIGGVDRVVVKTLQDPNYAGVQAPGDNMYDFFDIVDVADLDTYAHPYEKLFEFHQPASEQNFYNTFITKDWRRVADPRREPFFFSFPQVASDNDGFLTRTDADGEWFPNGNGSQPLHFPEWATHFYVSAEWLSMRFEAGSNANGELWVEYGEYLRPSVRQYATQRYRFDAGAAANVTRQSPKASSGLIRIPDDVRGKTRQIVMKGRLTGGSGVQLDGTSGIEMSGWFLQQAE